MSNVWDWWKLPSYNCQRFDFKGIISKPWLGYLKGIIRYFGSKIWKMRIKTNAKWQQFCRIWFLGGWIDPCQMFDFRENCLKTLTLWLGHLKGIVRQFGGRIWKSRSNNTRKWYQLKIFKIPSVWSSVWIYCIGYFLAVSKRSTGLMNFKVQLLL